MKRNVLTLYQNDSVFDFGKYKHKTLLEVHDIDKKYIQWCIINIDYFIIEPSSFIILNKDLANPIYKSNPPTTAYIVIWKYQNFLNKMLISEFGNIKNEDEIKSHKNDYIKGSILNVKNDIIDKLNTFKKDNSIENIKEGVKVQLMFDDDLTFYNWAYWLQNTDFELNSKFESDIESFKTTGEVEFYENYGFKDCFSSEDVLHSFSNVILDNKKRSCYSIIDYSNTIYSIKSSIYNEAAQIRYNAGTRFLRPDFGFTMFITMLYSDLFIKALSNKNINEIKKEASYFFNAFNISFKGDKTLIISFSISISSFDSYVNNYYETINKQMIFTNKKLNQVNFQSNELANSLKAREYKYADENTFEYPPKHGFA
ncbi:hypothetical protein PK28_08560 [Hymenobacter sp. DG25B]|uniref:exodeoxyribonuclease X C-terminal domain-containing protein n=1 Tax=Hymenobacter sp. DG25B TaxID=1385664 RepID=UPI000540DFD2|nr:hypothetical protein [Hymenobacter sp. DG25B]AIZ63733.1 hypothetical protein PK28_08560 [Hymenobacter sp. DG25B]